MKHLKQLLAAALTMLLALAVATPALAQTVDSEKGGAAKITINNAAKDETYAVYKIFDATVTGTDGGSIAYKGEIPASLSSFFTKSGDYVIKNADATDEAIIAAIQENAASFTKVAEAKSDGSVLEFTNLEYGYYVITTTQVDQQEGKALVTVTSTNPNASIYDKNATIPTVPEDGKTVNNANVKVGETLTYTLKFTTSNYEGSGEDAKQILSYIATDTLPDYLSDVTVTKITVGGEDIAVQQFDDEGKITIEWVDDEGASLYKNGAEVQITYTAKVNDKVAIAGEGNTNTFTMTYTTDEGEKIPEQNTDSVTVKTYALAIKKVDDKGAALAGAEFELPFAVTQAADGTYFVDASAAEQKATVTTPDDGIILVKGVSAGTYSITETKAPDGYNKLTKPISAEAKETSATTTSTTKYIDKDGNIVDEKTEVEVTYTNNDIAADAVFVVNNTGTQLPTTGGMGTTIFYVIGGAMVLTAGVLLITKRRMAGIEA